MKREKSPTEQAMGFEAFRIDLAKKSERQGWTAAAAATAVAVLEAAAIAAMMPLKTSVPFVVELDKSSGLATVLPIANEREVPASEVLDKYWLALYVRSREAYDYRTLENDFIRTRELSTPEVFAPYGRQFGDRDDSLEKAWGDTKRVLVTLESVIPNGNGVATVRFAKKTLTAASGLVERETRHTATLGYEYHPEYRLTEEKRLVNPFGFKVTSYRVDDEIESLEAGR